MKWLNRIYREPWLLPFLIALNSGIEPSARELSRYLGVRTKVAKRGLWILKKEGILEGDGLRLDVSSWLTHQRIWHAGKIVVWELKNGYTVIIVRPKRIRCSYVTKSTLKLIKAYLSGITDGFTVRHLPQGLNVSPKIVSSALRVLWAMGLLKREKGRYRVRDSLQNEKSRPPGDVCS